eukprot:TCONS_00041376-protein
MSDKVLCYKFQGENNYKSDWASYYQGAVVGDMIKVTWKRKEMEVEVVVFGTVQEITEFIQNAKGKTKSKKSQSMKTPDDPKNGETSQRVQNLPNEEIVLPTLDEEAIVKQRIEETEVTTKTVAIQTENVNDTNNKRYFYGPTWLSN